MKVVASIDRVIDNILLYEVALSSNPQMADRIRRHASWYAFREGDVWHFGPSKFVGYEGITAKKYLANDGLDGRETENQLKRWFTPVDPESDQFLELAEAFRKFAKRYDKEPKKTWRVTVVAKRSTSSATKTTDTSPLLDRIVSDPGVCGGRPCIRGTRMRVSDIVDMIGHGATEAEICADFPYITANDIKAALLYAARALDHPVVRAA